MKAVILAAGYATRLYPLTENMPKCLLKVGGKTILDSICAKLEAVGVFEEIVVVTNAKFYGQLKAWKGDRRSTVPVTVINDNTRSNDTRLGAIGDLGLAIRQAKIDGDFVMMASDNLFEQDLSDFVSFARAKRNSVCVAVYDIGDPMNASKKFGVLEVAGDGLVTGMEEKPEKPKSSLIGMGVYYFPANSVPLVFEYLAGPGAQDAPGHYVTWLFEKGVKIFSFQFKGVWYDIGDLKALEDANRLFNVKNPT